MALGEAQVKIVPDLSGFKTELVTGINDAMRQASKSVDAASESIESAFVEAATVADRALSQIDGNGLVDARKAAQRAGDQVETELVTAAKQADTALAQVDGDDFKEARKQADKAGQEIGESFEDGAKQGENALQGFAKSAAFAAAGAAVLKFAKSSIDAFADLGETLSKAEVIFGDATDSIVRFGDQAAESMGQSKQAAIAAASDFAIFGGAAGLAGQDLATFSTDLTMLASDLASFSNTTPEEAVIALGAALRGESEPIRKYGVLLDDATLRAKALEMGIYDGNGALTQQERVLAANAAIFDQTALAQGDFARTSDSLSNSQKTLAAQFADMQVQVGQALAPAMETAVAVAGDLLALFMAMPEELQGVVTVAVIAATAFVTMSKAVQGLGVAASTANVYLLAITATVAIAAAAYSAWNSRNEEAEARQQALNDAMVAANDPMATLVDRAKQLADEFVRLNPATEEATAAVEDFAGAQAFVQAELASNLPILARFGAGVAAVTDGVVTSAKPLEDLEFQIRQLGTGGQRTTKDLGGFQAAIRKTLGEAHPLSEALLGIAASGELSNSEFLELVISLRGTSDAFVDQNKEVNQSAEEYLNSAEAAALYAQILGADAFQAIKNTALAEAEATGVKEEYVYALEAVNEMVDLQGGLLASQESALEVSAEATAELVAETEALAQAAQEVSDDLTTYVGRLRTSLETTTAWSGALKTATQSGSESFNDFAVDSTTSIEEFRQALLDSAINAFQWQNNLITIAAETSPEFATYLADMGVSSADLVALLVEDSDAAQEAFHAFEINAAVMARNVIPELDTMATGFDRRMADIVQSVELALGPLAADAGIKARAIADAIMLGMVTGIEAGDQSLVYAAAAMTGVVIQAAKDTAGIKSPSSVFANEVGAPIAQGVAEGITRTIVEAKDAMVLLIDDLSAEGLDGVTAFNASMQDVLKSAEGAFKSAQDVVKGRRSQEQATERVSDAEDRLSKAQGDVATATNEVNEAQAELVRVQLSTESSTKDIETAQRNLASAQRDLDRANRDVTSATKGLEDANYALLQVSEYLLEQGPEAVANFGAIAVAAGLEAGEIQGLVRSYNDLTAARVAAAEAAQRQAQIDQETAAIGRQSAVEQANEAVRQARIRRQEAVASGGNIAAAERNMAQAAIGAANAFAQASGAAVGSRAYQQAQLDVLRFIIAESPFLADDLAGIVRTLSSAVALANGAIVTGPQFAMIGEAGPEAVIPLGRPRRAMQLMEQSGLADMARGSGAMVNIQNATFATPSDADLVAQKVNAAYRARVLAG